MFCCDLKLKPLQVVFGHSHKWNLVLVFSRVRVDIPHSFTSTQEVGVVLVCTLQQQQPPGME